jgi:hypothetical protein
VWLAKWRGVEVAVKEMHVGSTPLGIVDALTEAVTLALLHHPCVVRLYGVLISQVCSAY